MKISSDNGLFKKNICCKKNNFYIKKLDKKNFISVLKFYKINKYKYVAKIYKIFKEDFIIIFSEIVGEEVSYDLVYDAIMEFHLVNKIKIGNNFNNVCENIINYFTYSFDSFNYDFNLDLVLNEFRKLFNKYNFFTINHGDPTRGNLIMSDNKIFFIDLDDNIIAHNLLDLSKLWLSTNDNRYLKYSDLNTYKLFLIYIIFHYIKQISLFKKFYMFDIKHKEILLYYIKLLESNTVKFNIKNFGFLKIK